MEPFTLSLVSGALFMGFDRWREHRAKKAGEAAAEPRVFTPIEVARFTHAKTHAGLEALAFDALYAQGIRSMLAPRSVVEMKIEAGPLGKLVAWHVVPYKPGVMTAAQLMLNAAQQGQTVLGSHSLILLPSASTAPMLLLVGGSHLAGMAARGGHFALLQEPPPAVLPVEVAETVNPIAAAAVAVTEPAPAPAPVKSNGVANGHTPHPMTPPGDSDEILVSAK